MVDKWDKMTNEELAIEYQQTNDDTLFEYFANRNKKLTLYFANKILRQHPDWKEAIEQQGRLAIWKALKRFDSTKETKFSTYLYYYMLRAIQYQFREYHSIKLPFHVLSKLEYYIDKEPNAIFNIGSLDSIIDAESDLLLSDMVASEVNVEDEVNNKFNKHNLLKYINKLSPREAHIVDSYFGISDGIPKTLQIIGDEYGVTRERIRQIVAKAIAKLRRYYKVEGDPRNVD